MQRWQQLDWWHWDREEEKWSDEGGDTLYKEYVEMGRTGKESDSEGEDEDEVEEEEKEEEEKEEISGLNKLTLVTFNVMHDEWSREHVVHTDRRYMHTLSLLEKMRKKADLIGLNEVSRHFQQLLLKQDWVKDHFFVSDASEKAQSLQKPSGNLILSRFPFHSLYTVALSGCSRKAVVGVVDLPVAGVMVHIPFVTFHAFFFSLLLSFPISFSISFYFSFLYLTFFYSFLSFLCFTFLFFSFLFIYLLLRGVHVYVLPIQQPSHGM